METIFDFKLKHWLTIIAIAMFFNMIFYIISHYPILTENQCKQYLIDNQKDIIKNDSNSFNLDSTKLNYYTDVSISISNDSSYRVIFWGDRDSWKWRFKSDKYFTIDISYNRSKNINVDNDVKLYNILMKK